MFHVVYLTYIMPEYLPHRRAYNPSFYGETDRANDISALSQPPDPNTILWEANVSASTLDNWLTDAEIFILYYEEVTNEPVS